MANKVYFEDVKVGDEIPAWVKQTDFMHWNRYAAVNDEFVYIHMDDESGKNAGNAQGAFGMGNLRWAYLHNMLREWAGDEADMKEMSVQYRAINQKHDVLTCTGRITEKKSEGGEHLVRLDINVVNQDGKGMNGNTADCTTLSNFVDKIQAQYGRAERIWVMDRGIPTEEALAHLRQSDPPVRYLVGTPKGRLSALEQAFLAQPWEKAREQVQVKLLEREGELYVLAKSEARVDKERAMRRRSLRKLIHRLAELQQQKLTRDALLMKLGAAKKEAGRAYALVDITVPPKLPRGQRAQAQSFAFALNRCKLRVVRRREGRYLLRTNLTGHAPALLWQFYIQLTEVEQAFKELKNDLAIRPIYHQKDERIEAHIFVSFLAYCLQVTLKARLKPLAGGLTPRAVLEKFAAMQMLDVHLPTTDGRELVLTRHTEPHADLRLLLAHMKLNLPAQPPPKIGTPRPESTLPALPL